MTFDTVIARSNATKQSILPVWHGLLRFARNDEICRLAPYSITLSLNPASGTKHASYFPKIR
jgi:hypothetical protein